MYSDIKIDVRNLGKCYQIYQKPHERLLQGIFRGRKKFYKDFWALRNITFSINAGETVGIVGRNGSGKTTLLQLISGTMTQTEGKCVVSGRVAALLSLGAGFNPEYSGEENIHLYASLLGLTKKQIDSRFDQICNFAELGEFITQPVNKYSSGMYMRLAFAIAVHVEPDILIVDEALAVGDEAFQRKCYSKLESLKNSGMTLLFVSHSARSVIDLCDRAILIERGRMLASGKPKSIIAVYHKLLFSPPGDTDNTIREITETFTDKLDSVDSRSAKKEADEKLRKAYFISNMKPKSTVYYESRGAEILNPCVYTVDGEKVNVLCKGEEYVYSYKVRFTRDCFKVRFGMLIKTITGVGVGGAATANYESSIDEVLAGAQLHIEFKFACKLNPGVYFLNAGCKGVQDDEEVRLHRIIDAVMIRVLPEVDQISGGIVDFDIKPQITFL